MALQCLVFVKTLRQFSLGCVLFLVGAKLVFALRITGLHLGDHKDRPYNSNAMKLGRVCHCEERQPCLRRWRGRQGRSNLCRKQVLLRFARNDTLA